VVYRLRAYNPLFEAPVPGRARGANVTFEPGARTAWHTHALGQTLIVTSGCGRLQRWGRPIEVIRPGDVVWFAPGEKHWHGAAPLTATTHVAIVDVLDGKTADWMEKSPTNNTKPDQVPEKQEMLDYCVANNNLPEVEVIPVRQLDEAYQKVLVQ
jgi:quercetin dioxygenase-like cupin family protein